AVGPDGRLYWTDWITGWGGVGKGRVVALEPERRTDAEARRAASTARFLGRPLGESSNRALVEALIALCIPRFAGIPLLRIHGDLGTNNLLWPADGPVVMDFDDMMVGPAMQDLLTLDWGYTVEGEPDTAPVRLTAEADDAAFDAHYAARARVRGTCSRATGASAPSTRPGPSSSSRSWPCGGSGSTPGRGPVGTTRASRGRRAGHPPRRGTAASETGDGA
ncbi:MAG: phosphotransferase, partial [Myxococcota bacterium]